MQMQAKILAIVPAYNEQHNLPKLVEALRLIEPKLDIVVINDRSQDQTALICKQLAVNTIHLPCNLGIGGAVQTGYKYAHLHGYDYAVQVDGDGQHNPQHIMDLLAPLYAGQADLIIGSRYIKKEGYQSTSMRRLGIKYFSLLIALLIHQKVTDPTSGFRACNAKVIDLFSRYYPADYPEPESIVFIKRNGFTIAEVPVIMQERQTGTSSIKSFKTIYYMIKVSLAMVIDKMRRNAEVNR
ncbi:MAG: glycosyl transferase family 2 [Bacilli bacterium]|nr:glycosyl transferase family 2 [Bacilli bacterium]